jgi:hypothetical protein
MVNRMLARCRHRLRPETIPFAMLPGGTGIGASGWILFLSGHFDLPIMHDIELRVVTRGRRGGESNLHVVLRYVDPETSEAAVASHPVGARPETALWNALRRLAIRAGLDQDAIQRVYPRLGGELNAALEREKNPDFRIIEMEAGEARAEFARRRLLGTQVDPIIRALQGLQEHRAILAGPLTISQVNTLRTVVRRLPEAWTIRQTGGGDDVEVLVHRESEDPGSE